MTELEETNRNEEPSEHEHHEHEHDENEEEGGVEVHNDHVHPVKDDVYKL